MHFSVFFFLYPMEEYTDSENSKGNTRLVPCNFHNRSIALGFTIIDSNHRTNKLIPVRKVTLTIPYLP